MTQNSGASAMMARTRSVQVEFRADRPQLGGFDQAAVRHLYRMQRPIERLLPEDQEALELGEVRKQVVVLPHEGLKQMRVVRQVIQDLGRRETVAFELAAEG